MSTEGKQSHLTNISALCNFSLSETQYVDGELIGGCDIIMELAETGELAGELGAAA